MRIQKYLHQSQPELSSLIIFQNDIRRLLLIGATRKFVDLWEVEPELGTELMKAVVRVGQAINQALKPEEMNLITSAG